MARRPKNLRIVVSNLRANFVAYTVLNQHLIVFSFPLTFSKNPSCPRPMRSWGFRLWGQQESWGKEKASAIRKSSSAAMLSDGRKLQQGKHNNLPPSCKPQRYERGPETICHIRVWVGVILAEKVTLGSRGVVGYPGDRHLELYGTQAIYLYCCCSVAKLSLILCNPTDCNTPGSPVLQYLLEFAQIHAHRVGDAI